MSFSSHTCLLLLIGAFACREKTSAPLGPAVTLAIDDSVRTVTIDKPMLLSSLIAPPWTSVRAETADGRFLEHDDAGDVHLEVQRAQVSAAIYVDGRPIAVLAPVARVVVSTKATARVEPQLVIVDGGERLWKQRGQWPLADVIGKPAKVRAIGATELVLETLDGAVLKSNQRGEYVLRVWDKSGSNATHEVRRVTKIVVE